MADRTGIEWTDATWNPTVGCSIVSPGCTNCYAMRMSARLEKMRVGIHVGLTQTSKAGPVWAGIVREADLGEAPQPLRWKRPRRIFVNSMSDLFHENVGDDHIADVFGIMACAQQHIFQVLTKRPERMARLLASEDFWDMANCFQRDYAMALADPLARRSDDYRAIARDGFPDEPLPNVWLGVSVEDQERADERIPHLLRTPAALRFLSCEPLLGPINLPDCACRAARFAEACHHCATGINWVIAGGESGSNARPMHPDWVRSLRDQSVAADVPFFFKQWGEWVPVERPLPNVNYRFFRADLQAMERVGKRAAGAMLDHREWREFPDG